MAMSYTAEFKARALDEEARRYENAVDPYNPNFYDELTVNALQHKSSMETMSVKSQEDYVIDMFDASHIVLATWIEPRSSFRQWEFVKGSNALFNARNVAGEAYFMDAIEVDNSQHAKMLKFAYELQHRLLEDGEEVLRVIWKLMMPGMRAQRRKAMASIKRDRLSKIEEPSSLMPRYPNRLLRRALPGR